MRYDIPIYFQSIINGEYDAATGNYSDETITEVKLYANVTDTGENVLTLVYGDIKQGSKTVKLQRPYKKPFDTIRISEDVYRVDFSKKDKYFVLSEVQ